MTIENQALTQTYSRVNGGGTAFTTGDTPFESDDVFVYVYNDSTGVYDLKTVSADYTISGTTVTFNSATPSGTGNILILRRTDFNTAKVPTFTPGSSIRGEDLDKNFLQSIRVDQEFRDLKVDKFAPEIWADLNTNGRKVDGRVVSTDGTKLDSIESGATADQTAAEVRALVQAASDSHVFTDADNTKLDAINLSSGITTTQIADNAVTTAKIADDAVTPAKLANTAVTAGSYTATDITVDAQGRITAASNGAIGTSEITDAAVTTAKITDAAVTTAKITDANVTTAKVADSAVTTAKIANNAVTVDKINDGEITVAKINGSAVVNNSEQIGSTPNDTSFFTTSASDGRYFRQDSTETITSGVAWSANDLQVATTGAIDARIIDLVEEVGGFVPIANETSFPALNPDVNNGTGTIVSVSTIVTPRTPSSGSVTIANGAGTGNTVTITGVGSQVLTAGIGMLVETTSTLHTYSFHRLSAPATNVNTVATNIANVNTVAGNNANVTTVAGINSNVTTVAANNANVTAVGSNIANVNTTAANLNSINNFADVYRIASSDPSSSLNVGDLVFNTTNNALRVYTGSAWQDGVTATGNFVSKSGDEMTGDLSIPDKIIHSGDTNTAIRFPAADTFAVETAGTERLRIDSSGMVDFQTGIFGDNPTDNFTLNGRTQPHYGFNLVPETGVPVGFSGYRGIAFATNGSERMRIDSSGRLLVNTSTSRGTHGGGEAQFQIEGTNTATAGVSVTRKDNGTGGATFSFGKTRNGSVVQNGDNLGTIYWQADDGTDLATAACSIGAAVDGTPGANDMPGRIMFSTTADGASSPTERLRIDSSGQVILNNSASSGDATILRITGGTSGSSIIEMGDTADTDIGQIAYYQGSNAMAFRVNASERMRIDSSGNVGIGTTSASGLLAVHQAASSTSNYINITNNQTGASSWSNGMLVGVNASGDALCWQNESSNLLFGTNNSERLRIDSSGNVTVNTANNALINLGNTSQQHAEIKYTHSGQEFLDIKSIGSTSSYGNIRFFTGTDVERMRIDNSGNVFIGGTTASNADIALNANGSATFAGTIQSGGNSQSGAANGSALAGEGGLHASSSTTSQAVVRTYTTGNSTPTASIKADGSATFAGDVQVGGASYGNAQGVVTGADGYIRATYSGTNDVFRGYQLGNTTATSTISANGSATFAGAVSKGSGSFRISHPLPAKTETHHLVHSFIEGPQADLIYRGYADLVDGEATVNIDTAARMTEGTFEVLCTNISCFTSNESDWTAVKGSVTGNVLTITAQNATATSKVSWMVVGERKDQHMLDTDWTDNAGRVITEPLKVVDE